MSLFSENSGRWMVADQAVMKCGAADAVRAGGGARAAESPGAVAWRQRQPNTLVLPYFCAWSGVGLRGSVNHTTLKELRFCTLPAVPPLSPCPHRSVQVRGVSSTVEELQYILQHSESTGLIVQDAATLDKLLPTLRGSAEGLDGSGSSSNGSAALPIRFVVQLWGEPSADAAAALGPALHSYDDVLARGTQQVGSPD